MKRIPFANVPGCIIKRADDSVTYRSMMNHGISFTLLNCQFLTEIINLDLLILTRRLLHMSEM